MRKKIFATLMSVAMVASFMPSMAFAATDYVDNATQDSIDAKHQYRITTETTDNATVESLKDAYEDEIVEFTPATCTKEGSVTLKCYKDKDDELCTATKTFVVKASHSYVTKKLSVEDYAKKMQAAKADGFRNDAQVATKVAEISKDYCYVNAPVCKECGAIDKDHAEDLAVVGKLHDLPNLDAQRADCKDTVKCVDCQKEFKKKTGVAAKHSFEKADGSIKDDAVATSEKKLCGNATEKTYTCSACGGKRVVVEGTPACRVYKNYVTTEDVDGKTFVVGTATEVSEAKGFKKDTKVANRWYKSDTTVTENGVEYYAYTCDGCGYVVKGAPKTVASTEHKHVWKKVTTEPTCTAPGYEAAYCEGCGEYADKDAIKNFNGICSDSIEAVGTAIKGKDATGHKLNVVKKEATCETPAHYEISCTACGKKYDGAKYVQFKADPEKKSLYMNPKTGEVKATAVYGDMELTYLDPTVKKHQFTKRVVLKEATCEVNELSGFKCDTCGKIDFHDVTPSYGTKLGHKAEKVNVHAPTCENDGWYEIQCSVCKKYAADKDQTTWTKDQDNAFGFENGKKLGGECDFSKWVVVKDSTVFEEGVKELHCVKCNDTDGNRTPVAKKTVGKSVVKLTSTKGRMTVKASAANATGYKVTYKRVGKKAVTKTYTAENISKTYRLLKGKKYTVTVTAFASNGTDTVEGAAVTKRITIKK